MTKNPTTPDTASVPTEDDGVDFLELIATPIPERDPHFEERVDVVVRALRGLAVALDPSDPHLDGTRASRSKRRRAHVRAVGEVEELR
jgi:hypothetical protein